MAIGKGFPMFNVFGEEELPSIEYNGIRSYRTGNGSKHRYFIRDNMVIEVKTIIVHTISMGDVEDPDLMVAEPIYQWQQTDHGKWVMENSAEPPMWNRYIDPASFGHKYMISATFEGKKLTEYYLRFGNAAQKRVPM
jgi:hypothetical protein